MYVARLTCSDQECAESIVAEAETLAELETLACECGCGFAVIGLPDWVQDEGRPAVVLEFRTRRSQGDGVPEAA